MELSAIYRCVAALDVHQAKLTVCVLFANEQGEVVTEIREFGGDMKVQLVNDGPVTIVIDSRARE